MKIQIFCITAILPLLSQAVFGGVANPAGNIGIWSNAEDWNWRENNEPTPQNRVPEEGDTVFIAMRGPGGVTMELASGTPPIGQVIVGTRYNNDESRLSLKSGADLEARALIIGRADGETPAGPGFVTVGEGAFVRVTGMTAIGTEGANNGTLEIRNGSFSTRALMLGGSGTFEGSLLLLEGSKATVTMEKDAAISGASEDGSAAPLKLQFVLDAEGVSPIQIGGGLRIERSPALTVDLKAFQTAKIPVSIPLIEVTGSRTGEFSEPEILNLPIGIVATVEWMDGTLTLKLSR